MMKRLFNVIRCHSTDLHSHLSRVQYRRVRSSENRLLLSQHVPVEIEPVVMQPFVAFIQARTIFVKNRITSDLWVVLLEFFESLWCTDKVQEHDIVWVDLVSHQDVQGHPR